MSKTKLFLALFAVQILFGLNYVSTKILLHDFHPLVWAFIRAFLASVFLFSYCFAFRPNRRLPEKTFLPLVLFALFGYVINQGSFLTGLSLTTVTNASILSTLIPVFTLLIATLGGKEKPSWARLMGFVLAMGGALSIHGTDNFSLRNETAIGDALIVINSASYAFYLVMSKPFFEKHDRTWATAWLFLLGSLGLGILSIPYWDQHAAPVFTPTLLGAAAYNVFFGTLVAYFLANWALAHTRSSNVALFAYVQPLVATSAAWCFLDERLSARSVFSACLIFMGVLLATQDGKSTKRTARTRV